MIPLLSKIEVVKGTCIDTRYRPSTTGIVVDRRFAHRFSTPFNVCSYSILITRVGKSGKQRIENSNGFNTLYIDKNIFVKGLGYDVKKEQDELFLKGAYSIHNHLCINNTQKIGELKKIDFDFTNLKDASFMSFMEYMAGWSLMLKNIDTKQPPFLRQSLVERDIIAPRFLENWDPLKVDPMGYYYFIKSIIDANNSHPNIVDKFTNYFNDTNNRIKIVQNFMKTHITLNKKRTQQEINCINDGQTVYEKVLKLFETFTIVNDGDYEYLTAPQRLTDDDLIENRFPEAPEFLGMPEVGEFFVDIEERVNVDF